MLPDQDRDPRPFVAFIGRVCSKELSITGKDATRLLVESITRYAKEKVDTDCRLIWKMTMMTATELVIRGVLPFSELERIHQTIPGAAESWNALNDVKWYLNDNHDFAEPIEIKDAPIELIEALKLPRVITNDKMKAPPKMSRLLAVGVVRAVVARLRQKEGGLELLRDFRMYIAAAVDRKSVV